MDYQQFLLHPLTNLEDKISVKGVGFVKPKIRVRGNNKINKEIK